jgi:cold shock CspA family protein
MRAHGTLTKWNDDRGFGFISPPNGAPDIFVHISAFPRDGVRPRLNEMVSFEIEATDDGKRRAVRIMRPGQGAAARPTRAQDRGSRKGRGIGWVLPLMTIMAIGAYAYSHLTKRTVQPVPAAAYVDDQSTPPPSPYSCDGRTMCPQMSSCAEATYFIRNCPGTRMDGDGDGVPCEDQWCN